MQLGKLMAGISGQCHNWDDVEICTIEFDSRSTSPGALYVALEGARHDGHLFMKDVEKSGAVAVVTQRRVETALPQIVVKDTRMILATLAKRFYGDFDDLTKIGITGTNGKTTTTFLIHSILAQAGWHPGLIGTVYYQGKNRIKAGRTTPEIVDILKLFRKFVDEGMDSVVMEVSSHALKLKRVEDIMFDAAVFTNLSQDHLDFHGTMEEYKNAKLHLFSLLGPHGWAVYNIDDPVGREIARLGSGNRLSFGTRPESDVRGQPAGDSLDGLQLIVSHSGQHHKIRSRLIGEFNLYNITAAFACAMALGVDAGSAVKGIESVNAVRGRMERVSDNVFVDFAHTPSAIENILNAARKYAEGRLIIVFGCGGDRDREKRPIMGAIASRLADLAVVTSDNPRSEDPMEIIEAITKGFVRNNYRVISNRREAIEYAISTKQNGDIVVIAGKGHEEYQLVGDERILFDDAEVARKCIVHSC